MKTPTMAVLCGQPGKFSTTFQTAQLVRFLQPSISPVLLPVPEYAQSRLAQHFSRWAYNYLIPWFRQPNTDFVLYGNDGMADLRRWRARSILYWYDCPWNWAERPPRIKQWVQWLRYQNVRHANFVFAVSHIQVEVARRLRPGREASVHYLPVGVDCERFDPNRANPARVRERFRLPAKTVVGYLGYLGTWEGRFAGELLVEIAPELARQTEVHFLIVGAGPALPLFQERVRELNLTDRFTFTGFVEEDWVPDCIAAMDLCIDTLEPGFHSQARSETKLKQYMAMARACVATAIGENCVDLDHGKCGVLVLPGPAPLLQGIGSLCSQPEFRRRLGEAARERAKTVYDWRIVAAKMLQTLKLSARP
ncbi:MAG: glycosyltransferase [Verrucomicrobiota bacterium]